MILLEDDPKLQKVLADDSDIGSPSFCRDLNILIEALGEYGGMGLAAPQLGIARRLLLIESKPNSRYPLAPVVDLMVIVNPVILSSSSLVEYDWEGCLSVPGKRVKVGRSQSVKISFLDQFGVCRELDLTGFTARIFLHEYDHLEGVTILDRVEDQSFILSEEEYFADIGPS